MGGGASRPRRLYVWVRRPPGTSEAIAAARPTCKVIWVPALHSMAPLMQLPPLLPEPEPWMIGHIASVRHVHLQGSAKIGPYS